MSDSNSTAVEIAEFAEDPLSPEQRQLLIDAIKAAHKIRSSASMALFNILATGLFAFLSLVSCVFFGPTGIVMGIGLGIIAVVEAIGRSQLKRFELSSLKLLARNQFAFMLLLVGYSIWMIYSRLTGPNPVAGLTFGNELGDLSSVMPSMETMYVIGNVIVFGGLLLLSVVFQGANALFYLKSQKLSAKFISETPDWIRALLKDGKLI